MAVPRTLEDVARIAPLERRGLVTLDEIRECLAIIANEVMVLRRGAVLRDVPRVTPTAPAPMPPLAVVRHRRPQGTQVKGFAPEEDPDAVRPNVPMPAGRATFYARGQRAKSRGEPRESCPYATHDRGFRRAWLDGWDWSGPA